MNLLNLLLLLLGVGLIIGVGYFVYTKDQNFNKKYFNNYKYSYDKDDLSIEILFGKNGIMTISSNLEDLNIKLAYYIKDIPKTANNSIPLKNTIVINDKPLYSINENNYLISSYFTKKEQLNSGDYSGGLTLISNSIGKSTINDPFIMPIIDGSLLINCNRDSLMNYDIGFCDYS
jgi:hypothetical protein